MSRCVLDNEETGCEVVIGWDPGLRTFFSQVIQPGDEEPSVWLGWRPGEHEDPDVPMREILPYACQCDQDILRANLLQDKLGNDERTYSIDGDRIW